MNTLIFIALGMVKVTEQIRRVLLICYGQLRGNVSGPQRDFFRRKIAAAKIADLIEFRGGLSVVIVAHEAG